MHSRLLCILTTGKNETVAVHMSLSKKKGQLRSDSKNQTTDFG